MTKKYFSAICERCFKYKPRCATVQLKVSTLVEKWTELRNMCQDCRRENKGKYRLAKEHK